MISPTEENYIKAIYMLFEKTAEAVSTNAIAAYLETSAASVTDMLKRLTDKDLTVYEKYYGVRLSELGNQAAMQIIRKHRLWETFMVATLKFSWDEVHPIAEQLEHIQSEELVNRLDAHLGFPRFDPHGDPIPDRNGNLEFRKQFPIAELSKGEKGIIVGVQDHTPTFLRYVEHLHLIIGTQVELMERVEYDFSMRLLLNDKTEQLVSHKVCQNLFIKPLA